MVRGQFRRLRGGQEAAARHRFHHPAPHQVQEIREVNIARIFFAVLWLVLSAAGTPAAAADAAFRQWLEALWPDAQAFGISRKTFDAATAGVEPDLSLPDLDVPGRPAPQREQPEFVLRPADYLKEASLARLAGEGRKHLAERGATLKAIEQKFGVPPSIILAIWGRES